MLYTLYRTPLLPLRLLPPPAPRKQPELLRPYTLQEVASQFARSRAPTPWPASFPGVAVCTG